MRKGWIFYLGMQEQAYCIKGYLQAQHEDCRPPHFFCMHSWCFIPLTHLIGYYDGGLLIIRLGGTTISQAWKIGSSFEIDIKTVKMYVQIQQIDELKSH